MSFKGVLAKRISRQLRVGLQPAKVIMHKMKDGMRRRRIVQLSLHQPGASLAADFTHASCPLNSLTAELFHR
jgi:hypothetical protein